jgi:hypothetical protein
MPSIAESLNPQPDPGTLAYWLKPFQGYMDRQKQLASEGLERADQGAQQVRGGDLSGLAGMLLGPLQFGFSYPAALLPDDQSTRDMGRAIGGRVGESVAAGARQVADIAMPGPDIASYAPAMFLGVAAKNANKAKLARAMELESAGASPAVVYGETGWFKGADDKWRFEIPDDKAQLGIQPSEMSTMNSYPVGAVVRHPELYENYPELRNIRVLPEDGTGGGMNLIENELYLGTGRGVAPEHRSDWVKSVGLHELQHKIQEIEDFAQGGGKSYHAADPDAYKRLAGEVEARNVQRRMNWTADQRRMAPWVSEDVPRDNQIVRRTK